MSEKDGGPAFPSEFLAKIPYSDEALNELHAANAQFESHAMVQSAGMSLRDYFAAQALPIVFGFIEHSNGPLLAQHAYEIADAMLVERAK